MPRRLNQVTFQLPSGIITGNDSQIFNKVLLEKIENLEYNLADSLSSVDHLKSLGVNTTGNKKFINFEKFKDTILGLTYNEIYRLSNFSKLQGINTFEKIGEYLNAEVTTYIVSQRTQNITHPALYVENRKAYVAYIVGTTVYFQVYDLDSRSILKTRLITGLTANQLNDISFGIDSSENIIEDRLILYTGKGPIKPLIDDSVIDTTASFPTIPDPIVPNVGHSLFNFRQWGTFDYNGNTYKIIWSQNDAFFILNQNNVSVAKIGFNSACSFDNTKFKIASSSIVVDEDTIYFPALISTREARVKQGLSLAQGQDQVRDLFYPVGFNIIELKIDRLFPKVNSIDINSGLLISGPQLLHYDGSEISEFNFSEQLKDFRIRSQFSQFQDFSGSLSFNSNPGGTFRTPTGTLKPVQTLVELTGLSTSYQNQLDSYIDPEDNSSSVLRGNVLRPRSVAKDNISFGPFSVGSNDVFLGYYDDDNVELYRIVFPVNGREYRDSNLSHSRLYFDRIQVECYSLTQFEGDFAISASDLGYTGTVEDSNRDSRRFPSSAKTYNKLFLIMYKKSTDSASSPTGIFGIFVWDRTDTDEDDDEDDNGSYTIGEHQFRFRSILNDLNITIKDRPDDMMNIFTSGSDNPADDAFYLIQIPTHNDEVIDLSNVTDGVNKIKNIFTTADNNALLIDWVKLQDSGTDSDYSIQIAQEGDNFIVSIRNDADDMNPIEADFFTTIRVSDGTINKDLTLTGGIVGDSANIRKWTLPRGDFALNVNVTSYVITATKPLIRTWDSSNVELGGTSGNIPKPQSVKFNNKSGDATDNYGPEVEIEWASAVDISQFTTDIVLRFTIGNVSHLYSNFRVEGQRIIFSTPSSITASFSELNGNDKSQNVDYKFDLIRANSDELALLNLPLTTYFYAGFFRWIDQFGKEHTSGTSEIKQETIFGAIGQEYGTNLKNSLRLTFNNLNLTGKKNVQFILTRLIQGEGLLFKYVKEIDIDPTAQNINIVDDVLEANATGDVDLDVYRRIYQPPGCRSVAIGRRNRVFLGRMNGYANAVFYSNVLSNEFVDIFAFFKFEEGNPIAEPGRLFFDTEIIGLSNLDTNLLIFSKGNIHYLPVQSDGGSVAFNPQLIQSSLDNYADNTSSIVPFSKGVMFSNSKGIHYVTRGFGINWMSKNLITFLEGFNIDRQNHLGHSIVWSYVSELKRQIRFGIVDSERNPVGVLVYSSVWENWSVESDIIGPEIETNSNRFIYSSEKGNLFISEKPNEVSGKVRKRKFVLETGWINKPDAKTQFYIEDIGFIGDFGKYDTFNIQVFYDDNRKIIPEYFYNIKTFEERKKLYPALQENSIISIQSKRNKIFSIKLKIVIISDNVKMSAIYLTDREERRKSPSIASYQVG